MDSVVGRCKSGKLGDVSRLGIYLHKLVAPLACTPIVIGETHKEAIGILVEEEVVASIHKGRAWIVVKRAYVLAQASVLVNLVEGTPIAHAIKVAVVVARHYVYVLVVAALLGSIAQGIEGKALCGLDGTVVEVDGYKRAAAIEEIETVHSLRLIVVSHTTGYSSIERGSIVGNHSCVFRFHVVGIQSVHLIAVYHLRVVYIIIGVAKQVAGTDAIGIKRLHKGEVLDGVAQFERVETNTQLLIVAYGIASLVVKGVGCGA